MIFSGKGKASGEIDERSCRFCIWAEIKGEDRLFCRKKKKEREEEETCSAYEYDLLKRRPAPFPEMPGLFFPKEDG